MRRRGVVMFSRGAPVLVPVLVLALSACAGPGPGDAGPPASPASSAPDGASATPTPEVATEPTPGATTPPAPRATGSPARPPMSATELPTLRPPVVKPSPPTDLRPAGLVSGHITRGGRGPCYGLVAEDGTEYALHGPDAGELRAGTFVTLRLTPTRVRIDCGPGIPMTIVSD
ncbi:hypothetical protein [Micromonospora sp. WMMD812]|uniref:hypothetical protein n=1 Tax=Micromonospora sp. WMMD812 TaxID=3015152 RepID=UPI00248AA419|nr:hypothetical protein [Micromonospora sp. WMMD812]WBB65408.1 hypothetical protein O7603_19605 [Micromonospora sp. WMMD812]